MTAHEPLDVPIVNRPDTRPANGKKDDKREKPVDEKPGFRIQATDSIDFDITLFFDDHNTLSHCESASLGHARRILRKGEKSTAPFDDSRLRFTLGFPKDPARAA